MEIAITITAVPSQEDLLLDVAAALQRELNGALEFRWLGQGEAMDLILPAGARGSCDGSKLPSPLAGERQSEGELSHLKEMVAAAVADRPLDWCVQSATGRKKRMLIADMDSTIIGQESLDEMAELRGIRPEIAAITERAMRGELDFEAGLRERIGLLKGLRAADLEHVLHDRITLNFGARTLVETMKANGAHTVLVSGSFTIFTHTVAARAGFAKDRANVLHWGERPPCRRRRADPGPGGEARRRQGGGRRARPFARRGDRGGRWRQRPRHAEMGGLERRLPREAGCGGGGGRAGEPHRSHGLALFPGLHPR